MFFPQRTWTMLHCCMARNGRHVANGHAMQNPQASLHDWRGFVLDMSHYFHRHPAWLILYHLLSCKTKTKIFNTVHFCFIAAVDHCFSNPCRFNRPCINLLDTYQCDCGSNFTGQNCEEGKWCFSSTSAHRFQKLVKNKKDLSKARFRRTLVKSATAYKQVGFHKHAGPSIWWVKLQQAFL